MPETRPKILHIILLLFFSTIIIIGGIIIWTNYEPGKEISISVAADESWEGKIYIGGGVNLPGYYPCNKDDCLESLLNAAGGTKDETGIANLTLIASRVDTQNTKQKIDINRAEPWLLQALPGIGEILSERIFNHRIQYGLFNNTREIMEVEGIGPNVYDTIEPFITVSD